MINAYPIQLTATPVTYEGSTITKTTVVFNYDRYVILNNGNNIDSGGEFSEINTITNNGQQILSNRPSPQGNISNNTTSNFGTNSGIDAR